MILLQRTGEWYELACTCRLFLVVISHRTLDITPADVRASIDAILAHAATHQPSLTSSS